MYYTQTKEVLDKKQESLFDKKGVVAVGIGYKTIDGKQTDELSIICSVVKKLPSFELGIYDLIPSILNGVYTDVVETGVIKALHTDRHRPTLGGISIGHILISAGTLGCVVQGNIHGTRFILSNNHVLACSNDAKIGDSILQPGPHDSGTFPDDCIAELANFIPITFTEIPSGCSISNIFTKTINMFLRIIGRKTRLQSTKQAKTNLVDAAIAKPMIDSDVSDEIMEIGKIIGTKPAILGMKIKKSGRTTGLTTGEVLQVNVTVNVQYGGGRVASFSDQIMAGPMCEGGDSGSAVLDEDNNLVGLLFAGSDTTMVAGRIENVFDLLDVHI